MVHARENEDEYGDEDEDEDGKNRGRRLVILLPHQIRGAGAEVAVLALDLPARRDLILQVDGVAVLIAGRIGADAPHVPDIETVGDVAARFKLRPGDPFAR